MFYNRWVDSDAKASIERHADIGVSAEIALRVYTSQLIGSNPELVTLWGSPPPG